MVPTHCWVVMVTTKGRYIPGRERTKDAKRDEQTPYFSYSACVIACGEMQALRDNNDIAGLLNYGKQPIENEKANS